MLRFEATQLILKHAGDRPIVANLGPTTDELWHAQHRDRNFYTYGNMGLCSSLALGMAVSTSEQVISLDGDGSLLMTLGTIATIGREQPKNLIVVVWDNEQWGQTPQPYRHGYRPGSSGGKLRDFPYHDGSGPGRTGDRVPHRLGGRWALVHRGQDTRGRVSPRVAHRTGDYSVPLPQLFLQLTKFKTS